MTAHNVAKKPNSSSPQEAAAAEPILAAAPALIPAASPATAAQGPADASRSRERLVMTMMVLVTAACVAGLSLQFGYSWFTSVIAGAGLWTVFLIVHALTIKSEQLDRMSTEVSRLEVEVSRLKGAAQPNLTNAGDVTARAAQSVPEPSAIANSEPGRNAPPKTAVTRAAPTSEFHALGVSAPTAMLNTGPSLMIEPQARWEDAKMAPKVRLSAPISAPLNPPAVERQMSHAAKPWVPEPFSNSPHISPASPMALPGMAQPGMAQPAMAQPGLIQPALTQPQDPSWPGTSVTTSDPMRDAWAFRPKDVPVAPAYSPQAEPHPRATANGLSQNIDFELEIVQRKIKALAIEVNAAEAIKAQVHAQVHADASLALPSALDQSIGALKAASVQMRDRVPAPFQVPLAPASVSEPQRAAFAPTGFIIPATAERIAISEPEPNNRERDVYEAPQLGVQVQPHVQPKLQPQSQPAAVPAHNPRLTAITQAIHAGSMDVFLSPIVALNDHAVSHYEVSVRLRSQSGEHFEKPEKILELAGSDLVGLFDSARLTRSAALAERLNARGKTGSVLSSIAGVSMTDGGFLETFAHVFEERQSISGQLVLTLSQADIARLTPIAWEAIGDMHAFGFRFALEGITHLDTDFDTLARNGFAFIKLPAEAFIHGLPSQHGFKPAHEICGMLAKIGLTLVADNIDSDETRARVFGFGVLFGQGQLFGGARAMNIEVPNVKQTAAA